MLFKADSCNFKFLSFLLAWLGGSVSCLFLGECELETLLGE